MSRHNGFNLIDEPWIIVLGSDGHEHLVSILELFGHAHRFVAIGGEVPTQALATTRLLLAFLHRAIDGPVDQAHWAKLWAADHLPMEQIRHYAERVHHRFDLFDPTTPFFQVADLRTAKDDASGLEKIVADVPNGEPLFTTRSAASLKRIGAAEAARWLVHVHAFDPSGIKSGAIGDPTVKNGKGYPIGPGWAGQIGGVLVQGDDLRENLVLNLISRDVETYVRIGGPNDVPPWERDPDTAASQERPPHGAIDLYTWQTRRVRLISDQNDVVSVVLANGDKIRPQNKHALEPDSAWRYSEPQSKTHKTSVYMPRAHDPTRSVWRGIGALLPSTSGRRTVAGNQPQPFLAPGVLQWIGDLAAEGYLPDTYRPGIKVYGAAYGSQNSTIADIVEDELPLSILLLRADHPEAGRTAVEAVTDAEHVASAVWRLAENIAQAGGAEPDSGAGNAARESLYAALEEPYRRWLTTLVPGADTADARLAWQYIVDDEASFVAAELVSAASPSAWIGREVRNQIVNVAIAEAWFNAARRRALPLIHHRPHVATLEEAQV